MCVWLSAGMGGACGGLEHGMAVFAVFAAALTLRLSPLSSSRWVALLEEEMFLQGDKERELGISISPLCDRTKVGVSKSQVRMGAEGQR